MTEKFCRIGPWFKAYQSVEMFSPWLNKSDVIVGVHRGQGGHRGHLADGFTHLLLQKLQDFLLP